MVFLVYYRIYIININDFFSFFLLLVIDKEFFFIINKHLFFITQKDFLLIIKNFDYKKRVRSYSSIR